jgi:pimeloyl-ACP methyl ester carboxylesterase
MLYSSPDTPRHAPIVTDRHKDAGGWIGRLGMPKTLPQWLSEDDLDYYVREFSRAGFRGRVNYYRNCDRNHELMESVDPVVKIPALFIVGDQDPVFAGMGREQLEQRMQPGSSCLSSGPVAEQRSTKHAANHTAVHATHIQYPRPGHHHTS